MRGPPPAARRLLLAAAAAVGAFVTLAVLVACHWAPLRHLDATVADDLNRYVKAHAGQLRLWKDVTTYGAPTQMRILALAGALALWFLRRRREAVLVAVVVAIAAGLGGLTKVLVDRPRPVVPDRVATAAGQSFPSGHALTSFIVMALMLLVLLPVVGSLWRVALVAVAIVVAGSVAFSRLVLGVHYLSDVLGAWALGGAVVLGVLAGMHRWAPSWLR